MYAVKVFRFMSKEEFEKYRNGEILINTAKHIAKTNSKGFCFLSFEDFTPEEAMHFLSGIVNFEVCAIFETNTRLTKSYGVYAEPINSTANTLKDIMSLFQAFYNRFTATEYCTTEYDKKKMKLLKYSENIWEQWRKLEEQGSLKWIEVNKENKRDEL